MKFATLSSVLFLTASAYAQTISMSWPFSHQTLNRGENTTVVVVRLNSQEPVTELGIGITLKSCVSGGCDNVQEALGSILYAGPFKPHGEAGNPASTVQEISVLVPQDFQTGDAVMSVVRAALTGDGPHLETDYSNVTVNVA
ncbi:hypothetical protein PNOK_0631400 [Pyrrhoderma noxium]|uniref:Uncharacterized protein n=1 Tax=Pyrrhoderma noxium TaxID=2282107 RepID=A0A286UE49_9AGAM|nr:hypothetical protein PNOK_0631400 [Pyrrhoderma noxium]